MEVESKTLACNKQIYVFNITKFCAMARWDRNKRGKHSRTHDPPVESWPSGWKLSTQPMRHHVPQYVFRHTVALGPYSHTQTSWSHWTCLHKLQISKVCSKAKGRVPAYIWALQQVKGGPVLLTEGRDQERKQSKCQFRSRRIRRPSESWRVV